MAGDTLNIGSACMVHPNQPSHRKDDEDDVNDILQTMASRQASKITK